MFIRICLKRGLLLVKGIMRWDYFSGKCCEGKFAENYHPEVMTFWKAAYLTSVVSDVQLLKISYPLSDVLRDDHAGFGLGIWQIFTWFYGSP